MQRVDLLIYGLKNWKYEITLIEKVSLVGLSVHKSLNFSIQGALGRSSTIWAIPKTYDTLKES